MASHIVPTLPLLPHPQNNNKSKTLKSTKIQRNYAIQASEMSLFPNDYQNCDDLFANEKQPINTNNGNIYSPYPHYYPYSKYNLFHESEQLPKLITRNTITTNTNTTTTTNRRESMQCRNINNKGRSRRFSRGRRRRRRRRRLRQRSNNNNYHQYEHLNLRHFIRGAYVPKYWFESENIHSGNDPLYPVIKPKPSTPNNLCWHQLRDTDNKYKLVQIAGASPRMHTRVQVERELYVPQQRKPRENTDSLTNKVYQNSLRHSSSNRKMDKCILIKKVGTIRREDRPKTALLLKRSVTLPKARKIKKKKCKKKQLQMVDDALLLNEAICMVSTPLLRQKYLTMLQMETVLGKKRFKKLREIYNLVDTDGDHALEMSEVVKFNIFLDPNANIASVENDAILLYELADEDGNGAIDEMEWLDGWTRAMQGSNGDAQFIDSFVASYNRRHIDHEHLCMAWQFTARVLQKVLQWPRKIRNRRNTITKNAFL